MDFHHTCTLLYRFLATKDEEPPYSCLTGRRYSFMFYQISLYLIAVLVSTYSTTTYFYIPHESVFPWLFESPKRPIYGHSKTSIFSTTPFLITFVGTLLSIIDVINIIQVFLLLWLVLMHCKNASGSANNKHLFFALVNNV